MSKAKIINVIVFILLILLLIISVGYYIYDIVANGTDPGKNLHRVIICAIICAGGMLRFRSLGGISSRGLLFFEVQYAEHIKDAFKDSPQEKRKLLTAIKLYNENKYDKAIKMILELKGVCQTRDDIYATGIFLALCLTDMGLTEEAVKVYNQMIEMGATSSTLYGNLGSLYSGLGMYNDAIAALRLSIQNDEKNPYPYNNLAKLYFDTYDFENAKRYAKMALEINHKFRQPATLLAIVYTLEDDKENAEKYSHIALTSGETPERLKNAIDHYKASHIRN